MCLSHAEDFPFRQDKINRWRGRLSCHPSECHFQPYVHNVFSFFRFWPHPFPLYFTLRCSFRELFREALTYNRLMQFQKLDFNHGSILRESLPRKTQFSDLFSHKWWVKIFTALHLLKMLFKESRRMLCCKDGIVSSFLTPDNIHSYSYIFFS